MKQKLESRISDLPLDLRQLLFIYLLVTYRKDDNIAMIKYIYNDIPMRIFVSIKIDKRFWKENNLEFNINYHDTPQLDIYAGVFIQINSNTLSELKQIIKFHRILACPETYLRLSSKTFAIVTIDRKKKTLAENRIASCKFDIYLISKIAQRIYINVIDFYYSLLQANGDTTIRFRRNRIEIKSGKK